MEQDFKLLQNVKKLMIARYPRFAQEIANANLQFKTDLPYHTAATDGKNIYFDPGYLASLSDDDKLFIIAHELMHIKFEHMFRMAGKNGQMRDPEIWNIATDAIINANLERDGFKIKEGYVNMPEALNFTAEELYNKLLKEQQENQNKQQSGKGQSKQGQGNQKQEGSQGQQNQDKEQEKQEQESQNQEEKDKQEAQEEQQNQEQDVQGENQQEEQENSNIGDDHSLWEETFKKMKENNQENDNKNQTENQENSNQSRVQKEINEKEEFELNRKERRERAKQRFERLKDEGLSKGGKTTNFGELGESKAVLDWKLLLRREFDKTETIWSQRRSIAENNYAYRLEENDIEDEAETEVMIDVSGSVSFSMVREFLRQLKPLLKHSKLKVGCFDHNFYGFKEIKNSRDIDNFSSRGGGGTDFDLALENFTNKHTINKIVFTDGEDFVTNNDYNKSIQNVFWVVYGNRSFNPCCGKVIQISERDLQNLSLRSKEACEDELTM